LPDSCATCWKPSGTSKRFGSCRPSSKSVTSLSLTTLLCVRFPSGRPWEPLEIPTSFRASLVSRGPMSTNSGFSRTLPDPSTPTVGKALFSGRPLVAGKLLIQIDIPAIGDRFLELLLKAFEGNLLRHGNSAPRGVPKHLSSFTRFHGGGFNLKRKPVVGLLPFLVPKPTRTDPSEPFC